MSILAVSTNLVVEDDQYIRASEDIIEPTAWHARKPVCSNCVHLLELLREMGGDGAVNYADQWQALKGMHLAAVNHI